MWNDMIKSSYHSVLYEKTNKLKQFTRSTRNKAMENVLYMYKNREKYATAVFFNMASL